MNRSRCLFALVGSVMLALGIPLEGIRATPGASRPMTWIAAADAGDSGSVAAIASADLSGTGPGTLISATTMPVFATSEVSRRMHAARVLYRSTNSDTGGPTQVSGAVFIPLGDAPANGWPVVAVAHGTTGINEPCAPSLSGTLSDHVYWVSSLVDLGFAVALTDYEGLGSPGVHPYLDARTAGFNVIDSVRALRHTFPQVSPNWTALGGSQGGGAVWAADEVARTYAPELNLAGAVAWAPAADVVGLVDKSIAGTLTREQGGLLQSVIESLARRHPEINRDDYRRGAAGKYWDVLSSCSGALEQERSSAVGQLGRQDLAPATPQAVERLKGYLQAWAVPKGELSAPLSIVYGDHDEYIDPIWTTEAIIRACQLGGTLAWQLQPGKGHGGLDLQAQLAWIGDRFSGKPAANYCS